MPCPQKPSLPKKISYGHTKKGTMHWFDPGNDINSEISSEKVRPYIIIGESSPKSPRIVISPISDMEHYIEGNADKLKYPYTAPLYQNEYPFLDKDSVVLLDQVYTISKDRLCEEWYMGTIKNMQKIDQAIIYYYNLYDSMEHIYRQVFSKLFSKVKYQYKSRYSRK